MSIGYTFLFNVLKVNGRTILSSFSSTPRPHVSVFQRAWRLFEVVVPIYSNWWTIFVWLSIDHQLADTNRCQLTNNMDWFSDHRFPSIGYAGLISISIIILGKGCPSRQGKWKIIREKESFNKIDKICSRTVRLKMSKVGRGFQSLINLGKKLFA